MKQRTRAAVAVGAAVVGLAVLGSSPADADSTISLELSTGPEDADTAPGPTILVGETVNWFYQVTNTTGGELVDLVVTDDGVGVDVSCAVESLVPGASTVCQASATAAAGQYANVATATGTITDEGGATINVTASDPSHYFGAAPALAVDAVFSTSELVIGQASRLDIVVTNTGNVDLEAVDVTESIDDRLSVTQSTPSDGTLLDGDLQEIAWEIPELAVGQSATLSIDFIASGPLPGSVSNGASASVNFRDDVYNSTVVGDSGQDSIQLLQPDTDGDGVHDADDICPGSGFDPAPERLKRNRVWTDSTDLTSTFGCSASQIIADAGLGSGHAKFGISDSALHAWLAGYR